MMVLSEKTGDNIRNGGKRSRGPSPNGQMDDDTESSSDESTPRDRIRVGRDYQAICPDLITQKVSKNNLPERALLVWQPHSEISEQRLETFITLAKEKFNYNGEQALGMLFWHKYDIEKAINDLSNFTPYTEEWSVEDKVLFEQAFTFHGKSFYQIRQMLPDKTIASLVRYYYTWKKNKAKRSQMDRQAKKVTSSTKGDNSSPTDSQMDQDGKTTDHNKKWLVSNKKVSTTVTSSKSSNNIDKTQIRQTDQNTEILKKKIEQIEKDNAEELKEIENFYQEDSERVSLRWSQDEIDMCADSIRNFGKDFKKIASIIMTKNELQVRNFYVNSRKKYQLDVAMKEFEDRQSQIVKSTTSTATSTSNGSNGRTVEEMVIDISDDEDVSSSSTNKKLKSSSGYAGQSSPSFIIESKVGNVRIFDSNFKNTDEVYIIFVEFFHQIAFKYMVANLKDRDVVIVESMLCPTIVRETIAKVLFGHYEVASLTFLPQHIVALSPLVIDTALVVDCGYTGTLITPICCGVTIFKAIEDLPFGSKSIHERIKEILLKDNSNLDCDIPESVIEDIKIRCCFVTRKSRADVIVHGTDTSRNFELCHPVKYLYGGSSCDLTISGEVRETAFECLFQENDGQSLAINILEAVAKCPVDFRTKLLENILLIGGTCMSKGFKKRLLDELNSLILISDRKVYIRNNKLEMPINTSLKLFTQIPGKENYFAWLGGAVYGNTDLLKRQSISKNAYFKNKTLKDWF